MPLDWISFGFNRRFADVKWLMEIDWPASMSTLHPYPIRYSMLRQQMGKSLCIRCRRSARDTSTVNTFSAPSIELSTATRLCAYHHLVAAAVFVLLDLFGLFWINEVEW